MVIKLRDPRHLMPGSADAGRKEALMKREMARERKKIHVSELGVCKDFLERFF